jgi:hypothetical protein
MLPACEVDGGEEKDWLSDFSRDHGEQLKHYHLANPVDAK